MSVRGIKFVVPSSGFKKYTAILPDGSRVSFGDRRYEQYRDVVPRAQGGGKWSHLDHLDEARRDNYRRRHGATGYHLIPFTPAWFSFNLLW